LAQVKRSSVTSMACATHKLETTTALMSEQRKDDTQDVERSQLMTALEHFLYERYLEGYLPAALTWCDEMGARLFEEVAEELEALAKALGLKPFERKRLLGAPRKRDALGKPVIPAPALSPAVKEEPCSPEPEQEQSDDEPALPHAAQAAHAAQVRVKNTFIHVEPVPEASSLLARGETCPAATTFLMQDPAFIMQALSRLATPLHELPGEGFIPRLEALNTPCDEPPATVEEEKVKTTVDVPAARVGALIGKAGAALRSLEQATGAQVSVAKEARTTAWGQVRVVTVQGTAEAVSAARDAILAAVADAADVAPVDAAVHEERKAKPAKTTSLDIWEAQVSWVVGERGKKVADIEQRSGAVISVPKQGWVRKVVLRGDEEARTAARQLIEDSLPHTVTLDVPGAKIGALLGYRGETIKSIEAWSKATVSVPREGAMRTVVICGPTQQSVALAQAEVKSALSAKAGEARRGRR